MSTSNRYAVEGLCRDAIAGRRILVLGANTADARYLLRDCLAYLDQRGELESSTLSNGRAAARTYTGGSITQAHTLRGLSADIIYLTEPPTGAQMEDIRWGFPDVEVIRA